MSPPNWRQNRWTSAARSSYHLLRSIGSRGRQVGSTRCLSRFQERAIGSRSQLSRTGAISRGYLPHSWTQQVAENLGNSPKCARSALMMWVCLPQQEIACSTSHQPALLLGRLRSARYAGASRSARPPELNVDKKVLRNLRTHLEGARRRRRAGRRSLARSQFQRQDRRLSENTTRDRALRHVLDRDRHLQRRGARLYPPPVAAPDFIVRDAVLGWVSSYPISASRPWRWRLSTRCGTACGSR
jgi:hypothetical protein